MNVFIFFDVVDHPKEVGEKLFVPAVVKTLDVTLDLRQLHQVHNDLTRLQNFLFNCLSVHTDDTCDDSVGDKRLIIHDFSGIESGQDVNEQLSSTREISDDEFVDTFVYFESVFALPVTSLFEESVAFVDVVLDFFDVAEFEVDFDEEEGDVHFFTDFYGFFEGEIVGLNGKIEVFVVVIDLSFFEEGVSDFGLAKVLFGIFDLCIDLCDELFEGLLDLHLGDLNYF